MSHDKISAEAQRRMAETGEPYAAARQPNRLVLFVIGHVLVAAWTWRDIQQQPEQQIRGSKGLWRVLSAVNTLGTAGYWLIGRRYGRPRSG